MSKTERAVVKGWAGFTSGEMDIDHYADTPEYGRVYRTRAEARKYYQDVRRVEISFARLERKRHDVK